MSNSQQARWALFFNHSKFTLTYHPVSNIIKSDILLVPIRGWD